MRAIQPLPYSAPDRPVAMWGDASYRGVPRSEVAAASYVPARRIAGIQSMDVLRDQ